MVELAKNNPKILYTLVDKEHQVTREGIVEDIVPNLIKLQDLGLLENDYRFPTLDTEIKINDLMKSDAACRRVKQCSVGFDSRSGVCSATRQTAAKSDWFRRSCGY